MSTNKRNYLSGKTPDEKRIEYYTYAQFLKQYKNQIPGLEDYIKKLIVLSKRGPESNVSKTIKMNIEASNYNKIVPNRTNIFESTILFDIDKSTGKSMYSEFKKQLGTPKSNMQLLKRKYTKIIKNAEAKKLANAKAIANAKAAANAQAAAEAAKKAANEAARLAKEAENAQKLALAQAKKNTQEAQQIRNNRETAKKMINQQSNNILSNVGKFLGIATGETNLNKAVMNVERELGNVSRSVEKLKALVEQQKSSNPTAAAAGGAKKRKSKSKSKSKKSKSKSRK